MTKFRKCEVKQEEVKAIIREVDIWQTNALYTKGCGFTSRMLGKNFENGVMIDKDKLLKWDEEKSKVVEEWIQFWFVNLI